MTMNRLAGQPLPLSAAAHVDGRLYLRFSGSEAAVEAAVKAADGWSLAAGESERFWAALREQQLDFFADQRPLWRFSLPATAPTPAFAGESDWLLDWGGAQRWLKSDAPAATVHAAAAAAGGYATLFTGGPGVQRLPSLPAPLLRLQWRLRSAFDPAGIFNRELLYGGEA